MVEAENASDTVAKSQEYIISYQGNETAIISSDQQRSQASVYPNPVTDYLLLQFEKPTAVKEIKLIDLTGKIHLHRMYQNAQKKDIRIPTKMFPRGTYILIARSEHFTFQHKIIIQ